MAIRIQFHQSDSVAQRDTRKMRNVIRRIANDYGWEQGEVSIALVSDAEIHTLNREHLKHDYPTDVISFDLTESETFLEGEVIASVTTADRCAVEHGWNADSELLLYVIHGMLHVVGLRDKSPRDARLMRQEETHYLALAGVHR
jgi:probable rRNA maturation factor